MNPLNSPGTRTLTVSLSLVVVGLGLALATFAVAATDPATQYSGRATGVSIHTPFLNTAFADTGDLPSQGGFQDATFVQLDEPLAKADVLLADTMGFDNVAQSDAATATVRLLPGGPNEVAADFVRSQSTATCNAAVGQSEIVNLVVAGTVVDVSTAPNQVVTVPGVLTLVINEQIDGSHDGTFDMTVNALHLTLDGRGGHRVPCPQRHPVRRREPGSEGLRHGRWIHLRPGRIREFRIRRRIQARKDGTELPSDVPRPCGRDQDSNDGPLGISRRGDHADVQRPRDRERRIGYGHDYGHGRR